MSYEWCFGYHPLIGCVCEECSMGSGNIGYPVGRQGFWILDGEWVSCVWPAGKGSPNRIKHTLKWRPGVVIHPYITRQYWRVIRKYYCHEILGVIQVLQKFRKNN